MYNLFQQSSWASPHFNPYKGAANPESELELEIHLRPETFGINNDMFIPHPGDRKYLNEEQFEKQFQNHPNAKQVFRDFVVRNGLEIVEKAEDFNKITIKGNLEKLNKVFNIDFKIYEAEDGSEHLGFTGNLDLPENIGAHILHIAGLENGLTQETRIPQPTPLQHTHVQGGFSPAEIAMAYNFPENDASGECIGIVALGGLYNESDIKQYCKTYNVPIPEIEWVGQWRNKPGDNNINNLEVTMDIEMIAGMAPGAKIVIYNAPSIPEALQLAVTDKVNRPSVISISWALSELKTSAGYRSLLENYCGMAASKGITIVAASGDYGAYNLNTILNVMLPAAHPMILGVGGTNLYLPSKNETVWSGAPGSQKKTGSGGGYSVLYPIPGYQNGAVNIYKSHIFSLGNHGRGVPDIAANSSFATGYGIVLNGKATKGAGTSAATPVWAALIARLNKALGYRLGWINQLLYELEGTGAFNQVLQGNNHYFPAGWGWNPATGLGTPNGKLLLEGIKELKEVKQVAS